MSKYIEIIYKDVERDYAKYIGMEATHICLVGSICGVNGKKEDKIGRYPWCGS